MTIEFLAEIPIFNNSLLSVNTTKQVFLCKSVNSAVTKTRYNVYRALEFRTSKDFLRPDHTAMCTNKVQRTIEDNLTRSPMTINTVPVRSYTALTSLVNNVCTKEKSKWLEQATHDAEPERTSQ